MPKLYKGRLPDNLAVAGDAVADGFAALIPADRLGKQSYHIWTKDAPQLLAAGVDTFRESGFFQRMLCADREKDGKRCAVVSVPDIDELYYSFPPSPEAGNQYGDAGLFNPHIDGMMSFLPGIRFYRFIVALTPNSNVFTVFPNNRTVAALDKHDYLGFDFNSELHFVAGQADQGVNRILLKLHFCACDVCEDGTSPYLAMVNELHKGFEHVTRGYMNYGAKPANALETAVGISVSLIAWMRAHCVQVAITLAMLALAYRLGRGRGRK